MQCKAHGSFCANSKPSCLLQKCKAHGSFCANLEPSCNSAKLMGHSVPTRGPPAKVQSSWVILCQLGALLQASPVQKWPGGHTWSRDASKKHNKESKEASGASDSGTRQHTWSPPASIWSPPASIWGPPASISSAKVGQKQPGGHTCSAKLMGHSVPTWSPPATVQSSWTVSYTHLTLPTN